MKIENKGVVAFHFKYRWMYEHTPRFQLLAGFCACFRRILSVGCAGYEPILIKATHACDVVELSHKLLTSQGWGGDFTVCSCDDLPYPAKSFDVAICSEVIEHLDNYDMVQKTFDELDRVAHNWVITTPCNPLGELNPEKTHRFAFSREQLKAFANFTKTKIYKDSIYYYVVKSENEKATEIFDRHFKAQELL